MAVLKRRSRAVSFRLFEEEYEQLERACVAEGFRSLSEFYRGAIRVVIGKGAQSFTETLYSEIQKLNRNMQDLDCEVRLLRQLIENLSVTSVQKRSQPITPLETGREPCIVSTLTEHTL